MTFVATNHPRWQRGKIAVIIFLLFGLASIARSGVEEEVGRPISPSTDGSAGPIALPTPALMEDTVPATAFDVVGDQITFAAVFSNSPATIFQWQKISGGMALMTFREPRTQR